MREVKMHLNGDNLTHKQQQQLVLSNNYHYYCKAIIFHILQNTAQIAKYF